MLAALCFTFLILLNPQHAAAVQQMSEVQTTNERQLDRLNVEGEGYASHAELSSDRSEMTPLDRDEDDILTDDDFGANAKRSSNRLSWLTGFLVPLGVGGLLAWVSWISARRILANLVMVIFGIHESLR